jgi:hypothetical protein
MTAIKVISFFIGVYFRPVWRAFALRRVNALQITPVISGVKSPAYRTQ